ncbi:hypothetical protein GCM10011289_31080 [Paludibacterium paludis]|uniref:PAS domain S-box-containing protein/diguanylate cyclase (GGDEF)-like protein n=1 Tax=Paludibacterium paludis TaxID=1225769 RepID=A0A918P5B8_9NEIS|nr:hypothetical protein GCM10011289_31080 [Paludibacterium paludis]
MNRILLDQARELLQHLLQNPLVGIYLIQDGRFVYVNPCLAERFGYRQEEVCGKLGPADLIDGEPADYLKEGRQSLQGRHKDGRWVRMEFFRTATSFNGRPAAFGMAIDNSERHAAEQAVKEQLSFTSQLIEAIPNPLFYKDEAGRYLGCNKAFERFIGAPRETLLGKSVYDISPPDLAERYFSADQALFDKGGTQTYEASVEDAGGKRMDVMFYKATFRKAGKLGGLVGVIADITERKRSEAAVWHSANYDPLTDLPNRRLFLSLLQGALNAAPGGDAPLTVFFIDLDRFKEVNDTLGHERGDLLLIEAARRLELAVGQEGRVARLGGDEFTVIFSGRHTRPKLDELAARIIARMSEPFALGCDTAYVSASIGMTSCPDDARSLQQLLINADQAMYHAKALGRNRYCHFAPAMLEAVGERLQMGNDLRAAITAGQLQVHYQPVVELASGRIVGAEALVRWHHASRGWVSPARFIPVAEELGLINAIGERVFREAAGTALTLHRCAGLEAFQISVNVSPRQFVTPDALEGWLEHMRAIGLPGRCIAIEITEGLLLDERPEVARRLLEFRNADVEILLDDFGTGYSSMAYLKRFDIDSLKIDQSFVADMAGNGSDRAIVEAMIAMSRKLGLYVVAEGIETEAQRKVLCEAGCDFGQGYLFSAPVPRQRLLDMMRRPANGSER